MSFKGLNSHFFQTESDLANVGQLKKKKEKKRTKNVFKKF